MTADAAAADDRPRSGVLAPFHVPALDGLRALAFLVVFLNHAVPSDVPVVGLLARAGWCGVDVFFTLSGFLVTYLLLREETRETDAGRAPRFSLWRFWVRRALRIWPLYFLALLLGFVLLPRLPDPWNFGFPAGGPAHAALVEKHAATSSAFLMNWSMLWNGWPQGKWVFTPLWSVSVEEQFYVLWPLALWLLPRRVRRAGIIAGIVAAMACRTFVLLGNPPWWSVYIHTFLRADALLGGALLADICIARGGTLPAPPKWLAPALPAAYVVHASLGDMGGATRPLVDAFRYVLIDAMAVAAVWLCMTPGIWQRALSLRPMAWLGRISYGLYVWHFLMLMAAALFFAHAGGAGDAGAAAGPHLARIPVAFAATVAVAALSYYLFERPFLKLKERFA